MNMTCHACARTWEIEDDGTSAQCAFCGREHDAAMIAASRAAAALGKLGGRSTSPAKLEAVRENGKRGGRPRNTDQNGNPVNSNVKREGETWGATVWFGSGNGCTNVRRYQYATRAQALAADISDEIGKRGRVS